MQGEIQIRPWNAVSPPGEVTCLLGSLISGLPPTAPSLGAPYLLSSLPLCRPESHFLNHSQIFKRVYIPVREPRSQLSEESARTKIQSYDLAKCIKSSLTHTPQKYTNFNPAIPHRGMSPQAIIKQIVFLKKRKKRLFKDVPCRRVYTGKAKPPSCPTAED